MKNVSQVVTYYAWDTSANSYKTGDSANHTLRGMQDTTEFTPAASPSEVDSTNLKGAYKVSIAAGENIGNLMLVGGVSSTANIVLFPARWSNDPIPGVVRSGVAQAGAASTITLDASASATDNLYNRNQVAIIAGTGVGQSGRIITGYVGSTKVATVTPAWTTNPDSTSVFALIPAGVDVETWLATTVTAATAGIPDTNTKNINNVSTSSVTAINANQGTTQPINFTGTAGSALVKGDTVDWNGTVVSTPATAGIPEVNVKNMNNVSAAAITTIKAVQGLTTADTIATYTGNTPQTGDCFARIGANGVGLSAIPDEAGVTTLLARLSALRAGYLDNLSAGAVALASGVTVTTNNDKTGYSIGSGGIGSAALTAAAVNLIADGFLDRNMATGTDSGTDSTVTRTPRQALRVLRNKVSITAGTATVTKEDDSTASWTAAVATTAGNPISAVDPT